MTDIVLLLQSSDAELAALSLLHFVWEGAALGIIAAIWLRALSSPAARYGVACAFLLMMAVAPVATFSFLTDSKPSVVNGVPQRVELPVAVSDFAAAAGAQTSTWFALVLSLWLIGVGLFGIRAFGGWLFAAYGLSVRRRPAQPGVQSYVSDIGRRLGIARAVRVFESSRAIVPAVFGALRPVIVLPASVVTGLPPVQLQAILAHELAHVVRHDFLVNCVQTLVEVLLFYHPAVWWLSRRIRQEREMCCDAMAANICGDRVLYSRALLALEEGRQEFALAATGGDLKRRIEHLLRGPARQRHAAELVSLGPVLLMIGVLLLSAATVMAWAPDDVPNPPAPPAPPPPLMAQATPKPPAPPPPPAPPAQWPYDRWVNEDVVYIITGEERDALNRLKTDEERQHFIEQFWARRDPVPATAENEMKIEHYRRIAYANERFGDSRPGWATDRGQTYITYGPPSEIEAHPSNYRELWLYPGGRQFEFAGPMYELKTELPAPASKLSRIDVERVREPERAQVRIRLAEFVGQPFSNELMERIRTALEPFDKRIVRRWQTNRETGESSLTLFHPPEPQR